MHPLARVRFSNPSMKMQWTKASDTNLQVARSRGDGCNDGGLCPPPKWVLQQSRQLALSGKACMQNISASRGRSLAASEKTLSQGAWINDPSPQKKKKSGERSGQHWPIWYMWGMLYQSSDDTSQCKQTLVNVACLPSPSFNSSRSPNTFRASQVNLINSQKFTCWNL